MRTNAKENCEDGSHIGIYMTCNLTSEWNGKKKLVNFLLRLLPKWNQKLRALEQFWKERQY